jgi:hypothetical protein
MHDLDKGRITNKGPRGSWAGNQTENPGLNPNNL